MRNSLPCDVMLLPLLSLLCGAGSGLQITGMVVPPTVMSGDRVHLTCTFSMQGRDQLYSLGWWKDGTLFFSYTPTSNPPIAVFTIPGITVDMANSSLHEVVLSRVDHRASGKLSCEVLADTPSFEHETRDANMTVIDVPNRGPTISGGRNQYRVGDLLLLNCSSPPSFPPTVLAWHINGLQASHETVVMYPGQRSAEGCQASWSGLQMPLHRHHFKEGVLVLRCTASILHVYHHYSEVSITDADHLPGPPQDQASISGGVGVRLSLPLTLLLLLLPLGT